MNIREWFGYEGSYNPSSKTDHALDALLIVYRNALETYFGIETHEFGNLVDFLCDHHFDDFGKQRQAEWIIEAGVAGIKEIIQQSLPDDHDLEHEIEYEKYVLESELGLEYPEDLRSSLIGIVLDMPDRIARARERINSLQWTIGMWEYIEKDMLSFQVDEILLPEPREGALLYFC